MSGAALSRPNLVARAVSLVALVAAIVVVVLIVSGGSSYTLKLTLANADGLQTGSQVFLGGVPVGTVSDLEMNRAGNQVIVTMSMGKGEAHIGKGVHASIIATNLLGTESVQLTPGNRSQPLPSGTTLPASATTTPTALDQVVDTLNQPTRVDLAMMLREAGVAVAGRKADVSAILRQFPLSLQAATQLLKGLVNDNHSLADFIANSSAFIARVNAQGPQLQRLIADAGGAAQTFADRAGALAQTVQRAPEFFSRVHTYFAAITNGMNHLNSVAGALTQALPPLDQTLKEIGPFANAAVPTLSRAAQVAPSLSALAEHATPTLQQAEATVAALSTTAELSQPLSAWAGLSAPDLLDIFDSWTHAIQGRDGVSHIFNGDLYLDPQIVLHAADTGATAAQRAQNLLDLAPSLVKQLGLENAVAGAKAVLAALTQHHGAPAKTPTAPPNGTAPAAGQSTPSSGGTSAGSGSAGGSGSGGTANLGSALGAGLNHLLSGVLGAVTHTAPTAHTGTTGSSGTSGSSGSSSRGGLAGLLGYLLGK
jgi:phospholipid/cholesterol/gamma-HCH transport system substrate-binding protein